MKERTWLNILHYGWIILLAISIGLFYFKHNYQALFLLGISLHFHLSAGDWTYVLIEVQKSQAMIDMIDDVKKRVKKKRKAKGE